MLNVEAEAEEVIEIASTISFGGVFYMLPDKAVLYTHLTWNVAVDVMAFSIHAEGHPG